MRSFLKKITILLGALLEMSSIRAQSGQLDQIQQTLAARYPDAQLSQVQPTPISGLYQVNVNGEIAYSDPSGRFWLFGHLFDLEQQKDLTARAVQKLRPLKKTKS